jgi:hypothetical protein
VAALVWTETEAEAAAQAAGAARQAAQRTAAAYKPKFFTPHQWATVTLLVDIIIPKDERSGSATDAGVPEFMDFMMVDQPARQSAMRGGLAWLDRESNKRFDKTFVAATDAQRKEILDEIAWPRRAAPAVAAGVAFFNSFRDLTASGFFSSKMGVEDLRYMGNTFVPKWTGCPEPVLKKLGLVPGATE